MITEDQLDQEFPCTYPLICSPVLNYHYCSCLANKRKIVVELLTEIQKLKDEIAKLQLKGG